ncbi:Major Facilitator Superfamily protein [Streptomyces sp. LamerLS-31b]|nr:Major Facilitator Superfamily protein [Streptomyces sp. LamerLS-31b]
MSLTLAGMSVLGSRVDDVVGEEGFEQGGGVLGRAHRALSVGIVSVVFLIAFEATAVGTAMPVAARELNGVASYAFAFSGFFTTSLFGMVLAGQWADRRGPLAALTTGIGSFAAGLVIAGTAQTMWVFILGRAVQGLGGGLVIVALYVVVGRAYPERLRPAIMAAFAAGWVVPSIVGPLASGAVTEQLGWRWVFLGIPVLVVFPLALALPQIRRRASGPVDAEAAPPPSTAGASGSPSVSPSAPGSSSTPPRTCAPSPWSPPRPAPPCWSPPSSACCRAAPTAPPAACPPSSCCAACAPDRSSPPSPSCR